MELKKDTIEWRIHCSSAVDKIFNILNDNEGRAGFWAESAQEITGFIHFHFPNGQIYISKILEKITNQKFSIIYFDTVVIFELSACKDGGTDLRLINEKVPANEYEDSKAGWVSVLLALKAFADFGIDIRNHDKDKTWDQKFVDN